MCSWCWGFRPVWDRLQAQLPTAIDVVGVVGGLAKDCDEPMPEALRLSLQSIWHEIRALLGTEFNFDFWSDCIPRRSTFPACRAVLAAGMQGAEKSMIDAIQRAYYLRAMNPSDSQILLKLAGELHLDIARFQDDLASAVLHDEFSRQLALARALPISGFPSLILASGGRLTAIEINYQNAHVMWQQIRQVSGN